MIDEIVHTVTPPSFINDIIKCTMTEIRNFRLKKVSCYKNSEIFNPQNTCSEDLTINQLNSKIVRGAGAGQNTFPNGMALSNYAFRKKQFARYKYYG